MKQREESWKYDAQRSIFEELRGDSFGDETLCRMLDIIILLYYFSNKTILEGEIEDAKITSFASDFQTLIKHCCPSEWAWTNEAAL